MRSAKKTLFIGLGSLALLAGTTIVWSLPTTPNAIAGLSVRELVCIDLVVFLSGVMSGLSGFGFSAVGAASLLLLQPVLQVPLFQTLSTGNQLLSAGQLREDMPKSRRDLWAGPGPCMLGGAVGVPVGIWLLSHLPATGLMMIFGMLLTGYAGYSLLGPARSRPAGSGPAGSGPAGSGPAEAERASSRKTGLEPASRRVRGIDSRLCGAAVGLLGGVVGGFTAFPGAAVVVWTGLRGLPKARHRAIVQPYIIMSQIYSLGLLAWLHPSYLDHRFWLLLALTLPAVLPGTLGGLAIYRRMSDLNFKRVTYLLLGLSGLALLVKTVGTVIRNMF